MFEYPLSQISKQLWNKKVQATLMFSIPAQDQALPILYEILDILQNLKDKNLQQILGQDVREYFLNEVFPQVCSKIIKSRYFKNQIILTISNKILANSLYLYPKYLYIVDKYPGISQILSIVLASDQYYFKTNNQLDFRLYPHYYFDSMSNINFTSTLKENDPVDVIKSNGKYDKLIWSRGKVLIINQSYLQVEYLNDVQERTVNIDRQSFQVAPYMSKSQDFDWRMNLKPGDIIDCQDSFSGWCHGTVLKVIDHEDNKKSVKVTFKVYDQNGNKSDQNGKFYGFTDQQQIFDVTVPRIMPFCSTCKYRNYQVAKSSFETDDSNDMVFKQIGGQKIYALPRKRALSQFYFRQLNIFGRMGGFDKPIQKVTKQINFQFLCSYVKGIGNVSQYLHKQVVVQLVQKLKSVVQRHIFTNGDLVTKQFTKERSQALFSGLKNLMKRSFSAGDVHKYENTLKMKLVSQCLESQILKRKLQGLHELKEIVRSMSHISERAENVKNWIIQENIFDKVYLVNSHVQLIKKSQDFFKFLINEDILQVKDLERLYKIAQKGDYQSRVSLYKLFQEMSHVFNKPHVEFLIDTILESDLNLVLNQDIDMLHELSRFSNYFPKQKVKDFFQRLILNDTKNKQLNDYAIKKYSQIVTRGYQMKNYRRQIIRNFVQRLNTNDYQKVIKVLKGIFEGISVGEWGKKDITQIIDEQDVEQIVVRAIRENRQKTGYGNLVCQMLSFQLFLVKLSHRVKIKLSTLRKIWVQLKDQPSLNLEFYRWLDQIVQCDQGVQVDQQSSEGLQQFYRELFSQQKATNLSKQQFNLAKNLFVQINKKGNLLAVSNVIRQKQVQKEYKRKSQMCSLRLLDQIQRIVYECKDKHISQKAFQFYLQLYTSRQNSSPQICKFLTSLLQKLKQLYESKDLHRIESAMNLIQMVINDSQKMQELDVVSMIKCRKAALINVTVINDVSYFGDGVRKENLYEKNNVSLLQLKRKIAQKVDCPVPELRVVGRVELLDYFNSYTLDELGICSDGPLTVSRRVVSSLPQEELILQGKLNPKALRIFKAIFFKYASHDGQMSKQDYNKFTGACLGTYSKNYLDKISPIYNKYDTNQDGLLSLEDFLTFYTESASDKLSTVWGNLKNLNVKGNFKFKDQPDELLPREDLPRFRLYNNEELYDMLFKLLEEKQISKTVYKFLLRLPPNKSMHQEVRNIWSHNIESECKQKLTKFLTQQSKFRLMYKLILILNILEYNQMNNSAWNVKFVIRKGYQIPFQFLRNIVTNQQDYPSIDLDIIQLLFQIIKQYVYNGFGTKQSLQSSSLFEEDCTMDQKMESLLTGVYPKTYSTYRRDFSLSFTYEWHEHKQVFISLFLKMLVKMKTLNVDQKETQRKSVLSSMVSKLMAVLSCLMVDYRQDGLLPIYNLFFQQKQSPKLLDQFYIMILCICFYSKPGEQHLHIHQLFNYIKSKHITSQHFRVLSMLVSKFGFKEQNLSEIPEVLLKNIIQQENEPTIQGCARLLCNFQANQLKSITPKDVQLIFDKCLFGNNITCKKEPSRNQIYQLLIKISQANKHIAEQVVNKTKNVILQNMPLMKVSYSTQVNKKCSYGYVGLKNLGNICYMNSMIQQLYTNKTFRYLLLRVDDEKQQQFTFDAKGQHVDDNLLHQIQKIFGYLQNTTRQDFSPSDFCIAYKPFGQSVNIMMQQDVQQFVSMFFDRLQESIKQHPLRNLIQKFYTGKTANLFKCHNCKKTKKIQEDYHSISLQVKNSKNLSQSFNRYALGEIINDYRCDFCEQKSDVSKMTRISKLPQVLIIHLQRIVFNLDTFINQKITSKHEFPMQLNIYNYTLQHFDRQQSSQQHGKDLTAYDYELTGIIVHNGNAESGHYISYIKTEGNKWLQFNDSIISLFSVGNIEAECFGGMTSTFQDDFEWQKKQDSKSAYLLIYNRRLDPKIELNINQKQLQRKQQLLNELNLEEQPQKVQAQENSYQKISQPTESQEQTGSAFEDSQKQRQKQKFRQQKGMEEITMVRQKKSGDNTGTKPQHTVQKDIQTGQIVVQIKNNITPYLSHSLKQQIEVDNRVHFFQTSLASQGFSTFFAKLISIPHLHSQELIRMCQKLTFGFWLKSKSFKQLLHALELYLTSHPQNVNQLVLKNDQFFSLLIENSNIDIRINIAHFLVSVIQSYALSNIQQSQLLPRQNEAGQNIYQFLDKLFALIPTTVTKCWTKFNQYFQFWHLISEKRIFTQYLVNKQVLKHFADYFLDKKSPLKIYTNIKAQQIGSSYANPDFFMLLRCVSNLLNHYFSEDNIHKLTQEDHLVLVNFQFLQKLISQCHQQILAKMAKHMCPQNPKVSQKFAIFLLKGFSKSTYQNIQKYIEVLKQFVFIEDDYQQLRMEWVLGKQTLGVSTITKTLNALGAKNFEQRLYYFDSSLYIEQGASFLQPIYQLNKRVENFCILCVQGILSICQKSKAVRDYVFSLGAPTLVYARYIDFYQQFIDRYISQSQRSYYSTLTYYNKTQLGNQVKRSYVKLLQMRMVEQNQFQNNQQNQLQNNQQSQPQNNQQSQPQNNQQNQPQAINQDQQHVQNNQVHQIMRNNYVDQEQSMKQNQCPNQATDQQSTKAEQIQLLNGSFTRDNQQSKQIKSTTGLNPGSKKDANKQQVTSDKKYNQIEWQQMNADYYPDDVQSNKNNSRKSELQGDNSREEDFCGIQMKQINQIINQSNQKRSNTIQENNQQAANNNQQGSNQVLDSLNVNEKKSSDWSHESAGEEAGSPAKNQVSLNRKEKKRKIGQKRQHIANLADKDNQNGSQIENSADEQQPFIKHKESQEQDQTAEKNESEQFKLAYHPIQFNYEPVLMIPLQQDLSGIEATYHQSKVTYMETKPTGKGNKSFTGFNGRDKLFNRIKKECRKTQKSEVVKGYFVSNHTKMYLRIQTTQGCQLVKPNESGWIWSDSIVKTWKCQRSYDWPQWSMYE